MAREATPVRLAMSADGARAASRSPRTSARPTRARRQYEGAELTVAFNPEYLLDGLEVTPGDEITLETVDALKPALLRSIESPDFLYLLMPVRVS